MSLTNCLFEWAPTCAFLFALLFATLQPWEIVSTFRKEEKPRGGMVIRCDLASAGRGQVHRQCVLESWTGGCRNKHPARFLLLISCLFAQVGRLCLNTLRGKGSQSQPNGVTGYPRWTRIHDHWQKVSSQTLWMTVCMSQIGALSLVAKGVEIGCCFVCICKCWFKN